VKNADLHVATSSLYEAVMLSLTRSVLRCLRVSSKVLGPWSPQVDPHPRQTARDFSLFRNVATGSGAHPSSYSVGTSVWSWPLTPLVLTSRLSATTPLLAIWALTVWLWKILPSSVLIRTVCHSAFCQSAYHLCDQQLW